MNEIDISKPIQIKLELKKQDDKEKLLFIHKSLGSKFWSETLRHCINFAYNLHTSNDKSLDIDTAKIKEIAKLIKRPDVQSKILIDNVNGFINTAIDQLINKTRSEIKNRSIFHWEILTNISSEEREIISKFVECQKENSNNMVLIKDIASKLKKRNLREIEVVLDDFYIKGMIFKMTIDDKVYYHTDE